jgi:nicotinamidase-related amidase
MAKRIVLNQCCGVIIDVQESILKALESKRREQIEVNTMGFAELLKYLRIPVLATAERPLETKGGIPEGIKRHVDAHDGAEIMEKDFFDLTKHKEIAGYLRSLKRKQVLIAGRETDVGVLQSVLGLMDLGYEVFLIEDVLFSSASNTGSALERMKANGATVISLKTLYYELLEAAAGSPQRKKLNEKFGSFPLEI